MCPGRQWALGDAIASGREESQDSARGCAVCAQVVEHEAMVFLLSK